MSKTQSQPIDTHVDGTPLRGYLAQPDQPTGAVLVLHAWWGLTPFFKEVCDRLAQAGLAAFAPDLNNGQIANTVPAAEQLMNERDFEATNQTVEAAVTWLVTSFPQQAQFGLGLLGFSMGAAWAVGIANALGERVRAVVLFYGGEGMDVANARARFQGHFGEMDDWAPLEAVQALEASLLTAGLPTEFYRYPDTGHWFIESDHPEAYLEEPARLAWERTVEFLQRELAQPEQPGAAI